MLLNQVSFESKVPHTPYIPCVHTRRTLYGTARASTKHRSTLPGLERSSGGRGGGEWSGAGPDSALHGLSHYSTHRQKSCPSAASGIINPQVSSEFQQVLLTGWLASALAHAQNGHYLARLAAGPASSSFWPFTQYFAFISHLPLAFRNRPWAGFFRFPFFRFRFLGVSFPLLFFLPNHLPRPTVTAPRRRPPARRRRRRRSLPPAPRHCRA